MRFLPVLAFVGFSNLARQPQRGLLGTARWMSSKEQWIVLRDATTNDAPLLRRWDEKEHLNQVNVSGDPDYNDWDWESELGRNLSWRRQWIAETNNGTPIGFVQSMDPLLEETSYWGHDCPPNLQAIDIWIGEEDYIGKGYGTAMMKKALARIFSDARVVAVLADPMLHNERAHRFYQRFKFRPIGKRFFGPDECYVHRLDRQDWITSHTCT